VKKAFVEANKIMNIPTKFLYFISGTQWSWSYGCWVYI